LIAIGGTALARAGFSLVFQSLWLEAVQRAPENNRGLAMGTYNAFLDLTLGLGIPALGFLGGHVGLWSVFFSAVCRARRSRDNHAADQTWGPGHPYPL
jgi:predicted MFS family arabinose efflux permease